MVKSEDRVKQIKLGDLLVKSEQPLCDCGRMLLGEEQLQRGACEFCVSKGERCLHGNTKPCRLCEADT